MAQVKGTLWFDTNIQDTALKTAQRIRQQLEQEFSKQIDVKVNVQGLTELGSNSGAVKSKIEELTSSMTSHKSVVAELTQLYEQLNKQVAQFSNNSKTGVSTAQWTNKFSRESVQIERERTSVYARLNSNMKASIGISGQLSDKIAGLYSVYKAKEFLDNVIAIGGQLEQQRVSIGAILHDTAQADDLFNRIKGLALQSPFGVIDLDKYTKQLSAYGFQYNELFDMTKRLADISAGAGTDISRLALALGHVRSATYLTGITLRQFSMNNIPMLKMLADYYSEVEKRIVTTAEVQKRISNRDVGYDEVIEVIKRMTDEGGQFYNMQAVMADTLAGKWKNLKDAVDLMYGSIGESWVGGVLKDTASMLTTLTKHWNEVAVAMSAAIIVFGSQRVVTALVNRAIGENTAVVLRNALAQKQQEAARLRAVGAVRQLTAAEQRLLATSNQLTSKDVARLMLNKQLTKDEVLRAVAMKRLSVEQTKMAVRLGQLSAAEVRNAASMTIMGRASLVLETSLKRIGLALKSLLFNPTMAVFAGLAAAMEIYFHYQNQAEKSAERVRHALDTAQEGYKNLSEAAAKYKPNLGGTLGQDELKQGIDDMLNTIKNYSSQAQNIIQNALYTNPGVKDSDKLQVRSLADQYNILAQALEDTREAYRLMRITSDVFENANSETGGTFFWNDSFDKNAKDYINSLNEVQKAETAFMRDRAVLNAVLEKTGLFKNASDASIDQIKEYINNLDTHSAEWRKLKMSVEQIGGDFAASFVNLGQVKNSNKETFKTLKEDTENFARTVLSDLETRFGKTIDKWGQAERFAAQQSLVTHIKSIEGMTDESAKKIEELVYGEWNKTNDFVKNHPFKVDADVDRAVKQVSEFQQYLEGLVGKDWIVTLKLQKVGSFEELYDQLDKNVKEGKETMRKLRDGLTESERQQAEALMTDVSKLTKKQLEYREAFLKTEKSRAAAREEGYKLTADEEKKKKTGAGSRGGTKKDAEFEAWKLRLDALKAFYAEWNSLRKEMGKTGAYNEIFKSGIMPDMFDANGKPKYDLDNYAEELGKMNNALAGNTDARKKAKQNLKKEQFKELTQNAKEASDAIIDEFKRATDEISKQWDNYKSLYDKTGNKSFASLAFSDNVLWDEKAKDMAERLRTEMNVGTISYEMSDKEAKKFFDYNTTRGKSLYETWKQIVDLIKGNYTKALNESADAIASLKTEEEKIAQIEQKIADLKEKEKASDNDPRILKMQKDIASIRSEGLKKSSDYLRFYNSILSMTIPEAERIGQTIRKNLNKELANGTITAKEYVRQVKMITEQLSKLKNRQNELSSFITGGLQGLFQNRYDTAESNFNNYATQYAQAAKDYAKAVEKGNEAGMQNAENAMNASESMMKGAGAAMEGAQGAMNTMAIIDRIVHGINDTVQGIKGAFEDIKETYEALGKDTNTSGWQDAGTFLNAFSSASQSATNAWDSLKNGNMGGVIQGVVGSFTGWIKGFAKGWDNKMDNQIRIAQEQLNATERLKGSIEKRLKRTLGSVYEYRQSDETNNLLKEAIERTERVDEKTYGERARSSIKSGALGSVIGGIAGPIGAVVGGVIGNIIGAKTKKYTVNYYQDDTIKAMQEAMNSRAYFDEQYALLYKERDELRHQLESEQSKKNGDNEKIEDYKASISEVEDKIKDFATDLAKTLYEIDVKSWANELGDALVDAWTKGEDAAKAWSEKVKDLISNVTKNIVTQKIVESALQPVLDLVESEMFAKKGLLDESSVVQLAQKLEEAGNIAIPSVEAFLNAMKQAGYDISSSATSSASQVLSGLSEDDQGLLMSYINAIRADVSINRTIMERMIVQIETSLPNVGQNIAEHTTLLRSIEANTSRNALSAEVMEGVLTRMERGEFSIRVK